MKRHAIWLLVLLAGCAEPDRPDGNVVSAANEARAGDAADGSSNSARRPAGVPSPAESRQEPAAGGPDPEDDDAARRDACRSRQYRYLVGQHRSRIPAKPAGETWRVTCTSCPITMDYSESRLNIFYDEESGIVEAVRCG